MRALGLVIAFSLSSFAFAGCVEPDLGDAPLLCNAGTPRCPANYVCVARKDGSEQCVREGSARASSLARDGGVAVSDGE